MKFRFCENIARFIFNASDFFVGFCLTRFCVLLIFDDIADPANRMDHAHVLILDLHP